MRPQHNTLTSEVIYRQAANLLQAQLQWVDYGRQCTVKTLFLVLFYAAGQLCSLSMACQRLRATPSDQAVRDALQLAQFSKAAGLPPGRPSCLGVPSRHPAGRDRRQRLLLLDARA